MIEQLRPMAIFAYVVQEGSFRGAAKELGLAPSRVSAIVSELEESLGVTLLYRSTRKISLTNEGKVLHDHTSDMLRSVDEGLNELNALSKEPSGNLRISIPAFLASGPLNTAIVGFSKRYRNVKFSVTYTDRLLPAIEEGFDVKIRVGWLEDSALMSRKFSTGQRWLVAGTEYAQEHKVPERPLDLSGWQWIRFMQQPEKLAFLSPDGEKESVNVKSQIEVDSIDAVYHLCKENAGAAVLPSFLAERGIREGKFRRLLPDWELSPLGIYAVWPDNSRRESLALVFVRYLAEQGLC